MMLRYSSSSSSSSSKMRQMQRVAGHLSSNAAGVASDDEMGVNTKYYMLVTCYLLALEAETVASM